MKSKSKTAYNKQAAPYMYGAADNLKAVVNANAPQLQQTADTMSGFANTLGARVFGGDPLTTAAKGYAGDVLGGKYLGAGNPYLDSMVGEARSNAFDTVNTGFGRSGMAGGTTHGGALGRGLGQAELGLRYADYNTERGRMDQFANNAGQMAISDLAGLPMYASLAGQSAALPYLGATTLASGMGGLLGNQLTTTSKGSLAQMLMQGANNLGAAYAGGG